VGGGERSALKNCGATALRGDVKGDKNPEGKGWPVRKARRPGNFRTTTKKKKKRN